MSDLVSVWLRAGKLYVAALVHSPGPTPGTFGPSVAAEPVIATEPQPGLLAAAILEVLAAEHPPVPLDWFRQPELKRFPVLAKAGVRSNRQFEEGLSTCSLLIQEETAQIENWKPAPGGRGFIGDQNIILPRATPLEQVAERMLQELRDPRHIKQPALRRRARAGGSTPPAPPVPRAAGGR